MTTHESRQPQDRYPHSQAFCSTHARRLFLAWLLFAVAAAAGHAGPVVDVEYIVHPPAQSGYEANRAIINTFGGGGLSGPTLVVVTLPDGTDVRSARFLAAHTR
jgi:hypothetical protein